MIVAFGDGRWPCGALANVPVGMNFDMHACICDGVLCPGTGFSSEAAS